MNGYPLTAVVFRPLKFTVVVIAPAPEYDILLEPLPLVTPHAEGSSSHNWSPGFDLATTIAMLPLAAFVCDTDAGVPRVRLESLVTNGVAVGLGVGLGEAVGVVLGLAVGLGVGLFVGVGVGVGVGVCEGVGLGLRRRCASAWLGQQKIESNEAAETITTTR